ncbi:pentatricopeptide repeat-containing protein At2g20710, mitochondrial-like [Durio zibethinus]|uniref:Pentatricopeptide repeat-containing protein At2g20710, mitochondrial-like n=1 Tax=Durio zibethinus TaxID=66656 RepID=A0A6P6AGQ6_DURZI|nr:pentatricopeptide repeat-containing protein At2g20710, mitochondrial-like [Durio zibethinus]
MKHLIGSNPWTNSGISRVLRVLSYSTKTLSPNTSPSKARDSLHIRASRTGDPKASIVPVLNQWLEEGKPIKQSMLQTLIRQLRSFRRFKHALEVSEYMSEEMNYDISTGDMAVRLDLISKVHGVAQAEKYLDSIPVTMRTFQVYGALLNCYAHHKCLEKAEATMHNMRESGFPINVVSYNVMLNLYRNLGKHDKLDDLMQEMKEKGIKHDTFTNNIRLNAYASSSDIEGMEKFLTKMENDVEISFDWHAYVVAANAYLKARLTEKASQMLNRAEQLVTPETRRNAYEVFLTIYTNLGRKDDVYRIWILYGNLGKLRNSGYLCMISSLVKLDDLDGAEKILVEWESGYTVFDSRIPNVMIAAYCKRGFIEKAEAYISNLIERSVIKEPDAFILNSLATGYQIDGQMAKAVETMKKAILASISGWKPNIVTLAACLRFLKGENNIEVAEELLQLLRVRGYFSIDVYDKLVMNIRDRNLDESVLDQIKGDEETGRLFVEESASSHGGQIEGSS